jgi:DNA-binding MarR family transcriptional regulator
MSREPSRIQNELKQSRPFPTRAQEATVALMRTADMVRRALAVSVEPAGITGQQYNVLRILRGAGERGLPTLEIAARMIEETPGITRLIDRLEGKHYVSRERCATDRRQVFCRITAEGLQLLESLDVPIGAAGELVMKQFVAAEVKQLIELLDRTRDGAQQAIAHRESLEQTESNPKSNRNRENAGPSIKEKES